jgi:CRISPR/Cas system-associated protein Cas5 (RAMP superfamily)
MTLTEIHKQIEEISERRSELWHTLSEAHNPTAAAELKSLSDKLDHLWDEERALKAALRFGDRERIVARARVEERLERAA